MRHRPLHLDLHSVLFAPSAEDADLLTAELWERGTAGLMEEGSLIRAFFEDEVDYSDLLRMYPVLEMRVEDPVATGAAKEDCDPVFVGEKFFIVPAGSTLPTPEGRYRLTIDDTMAFGTGRHESTQLMLSAMEQILKPGASVLDVGTGTGILSQAAEMLGATRIVSCDLFAYGLRRGRRGYRHTFVGSADALMDEIADITLANITPRVLDALAYDLKRVTAAGGRVLISGFLRNAEPTCFKPEAEWELNGWLCWLCQRDGIEADERRGEIIIHDQNWW